MGNDTPVRKDNPIELEYYKKGEIEPIHLIESQELSFIEGNIVKYICRYKKSDNGKNDLLKILWYIKRLLFTKYGVS